MYFYMVLHSDNKKSITINIPSQSVANICIKQQIFNKKLSTEFTKNVLLNNYHQRCFECGDGTDLPIGPGRFIFRVDVHGLEGGGAQST